MLQGKQKIGPGRGVEALASILGLELQFLAVRVSLGGGGGVEAQMVRRQLQLEACYMVSVHKLGMVDGLSSSCTPPKSSVQGLTAGHTLKNVYEHAFKQVFRHAQICRRAPEAVCQVSNALCGGSPFRTTLQKLWFLMIPRHSVDPGFINPWLMNMAVFPSNSDRSPLKGTKRGHPPMNQPGVY